MSTGCGDESNPPPQQPVPTAEQLILQFDPSAVQANTAALPPGFSGPSSTACGPDPSQAFLAEALTHGLSGAKIQYQWAPVVAGPVPGRPTVRQPEFYLAGTVQNFQHSTSDLDFSHPFGRDAITRIHPDAPFASLASGNSSAEGGLQSELDQGLFPEAAFGYVPAAGDRVLHKGAWILDCGHPPYQTELHPPTFVAYARAQGTSTMGLVFVNPYRVAQLYSQDPAVVTAFGDPARFTVMGTMPFLPLLASEIQTSGLSRLVAHALLEPLRFDSVIFYVCAPAPRPAGATLDQSYRFTVRTGVNVQVAPDNQTGCVRFELLMDSSYQPLVPQRSDRVWPWSQIAEEASAEAGVPVDIQGALGALGAAAGLLTDANSPIIDQYPPQQPRPDASLDSPTAITTGADDQPFPAYGRVRVFWR